MHKSYDDKVDLNHIYIYITFYYSKSKIWI